MKGTNGQARGGAARGRALVLDSPPASGASGVSRAKRPGKRPAATRLPKRRRLVAVPTPAAKILRAGAGVGAGAGAGCTKEKSAAAAEAIAEGVEEEGLDEGAATEAESAAWSRRRAATGARVLVSCAAQEAASSATHSTVTSGAAAGGAADRVVAVI